METRKFSFDGAGKIRNGGSVVYETGPHKGMKGQFVSEKGKTTAYEVRGVNPATGRYGAFFVFATKPDFDRFVASELFGAISAHSSIGDLKASDYSISDRPTAVTRGPVVQRT